MTEPIPDTWHSRDLPALRTIVRLYDETIRPVSSSTIATETGLSAEDVRRAGRALVDDNLVTTGGGQWQRPLQLFGGVTGEARRLTGSWPSADAAADRLITALTEVADNSSDPVEKAKARKALDALGTFSRDLLVSVAGAAAGVAMQ